MVDWLISLLLGLWEGVLLAGLLIRWVLLWTVGLPLVVLIHELGHAAAIRMRGLQLEMLAVGDREDVLVRIGRTVLRLGRPERGDWSGFVTLDPDASSEDLIVIALAGPLANLLTAPLFAVAALSGATHGDLDHMLWILAGVSAVAVVENLVPSGAPEVGQGVSDGRWIQHALAVRSGRPLPEPGPEPAPPEDPVAAEAHEGTFRAPFKAALVLLVLLILVLGGLTAAVAITVPIVAFIGVGYLMGAHRQKIF